jgi:cbb3-type cytochrome c oxidase subunit III
MTRNMQWAGMIATLMLVIVIPLYAILEPVQQAERRIDLLTEAVHLSTDLYAENCAVCHGAAGEGLGGMPALNTDGIRLMDAETLTRTVARGRSNTVMAAWAVDEGGILSLAQIEQMVTFLQNADWPTVEARVAELGLTPPEIVAVEIPEEMLLAVANLPDGEPLSRALTIYGENCAACHGGDGSGTAIAPVLNSAELRANNTDDDLRQIIENGVTGTLMAGWVNTLDSGQIDDMVGLIRRWEEIDAAGIELPAVVEASVIESTPEMIAQGAQLFSVACTACHGVDGYGTRMAPALNNATFLSETPDQAIIQIIAQGVPGTMMPAWGARLSNEEINAITAYLRSLEATAPPVATTSTTTTGRGGPPSWAPVP